MKKIKPATVNIEGLANKIISDCKNVNQTIDLMLYIKHSIMPDSIFEAIESRREQEFYRKNEEMYYHIPATVLSKELENNIKTIKTSLRKEIANQLYLSGDLR